MALLAACQAGPSGVALKDPLQAAYGRYVAAIESARSTIRTSPGMRDASDRAEGESFLHGIVDYAVGAALLMTPEAPLMHLLPHPDARLGFHNPDNLYYVARVSDRGTYTLRGDRGGSRTFLVQALRGLPGLEEGKGETLAFLAGGDLRTQADGSFVITLGAEPPESGNWLPLEPGTDNLLVRFSFLDWRSERPGSISIRRGDAPGAGSVRITRALAVAMLDDAATSIEQQARFYSRFSAQILRIGVNRIHGPSSGNFGTSSTRSGYQASHTEQWRLLGTFDLRDDEAMVVTVKDAPQAEYGNFMAANAWLDTFEFVRHQPSLNRSQVRVDADGRIRYVVSARDPGVPNWIDTTGRRHGILFARWQEVAGGLGPEFAPETAVVKRSELRTVLPRDTPVVTPEQRAARLAERERLLRTRYRNADPALPEVLRRLREVEALLGRTLPVQSLDDTILD